MMHRSPSVEEFVRDPIGQWVVATPTCIAFCATANLCGSVVWGRPTREETLRALEAYEGFRHPNVAPKIDFVADGREIDGIEAESLSTLVEWCNARKAELASRIRVQIGVVSESMVGLTLAGIFPVVGDTHAFRIVRDPREAFRALSPTGDELCDEVEACVRAARGESRELHALRDLLRRQTDLSIEASARALALSVRTLQRVLQESGTTFKKEVRDARFSIAHDLLVHGDDKVAAVALRVRLSENALVQLVREKTGLTPAELRKLRP